MADFKTIENEYLNIDPYDKIKLIPFYERHKNYFDTPPSDINELRKYLWMLAEIGETFSLDHQPKIALPLLDKVINLYEQNHERLKIKLDDEREYNYALLSQGYSLLELKQYYKAKSYLKRFKGSKLDIQFDLETILRICDREMKNRVAIILGVTGLLILIVKYSIKWFSPENYSSLFVHSGFLGGLLLIVSGLLYKTKIKRALTGVQRKAG